MIRDVILLASVIVLAGGARSFLPADATVTGSGAALAVGFVILAAMYAGRIFNRLKMPHLTGFLLCGAALGPEMSGALTGAMLHDLSLVKRVAVGLIALVAGCELNLRALRPQMRPIGMQAAGGLGLAGLGLFAFFWFALPHLAATDDLVGGQRAAVALVLATVLCALSPAVVIGLLGETRAAGPLSDAALSIVVLADLAIVVAFTGSNAIAGSVFATEGAPAVGGFSTLALHLGGSAAVGALIGAVLAVYVVRVGRRVALFVFSVLFVVAEAGVSVHLDPLLVGLTAGLVLENASPVSGGQVVRETEPATVPIYALFFGVIGAEIHLRDFMAVAGWAIGAAAVRALAFVIGTGLGGRAAGVDPALSRLLPLGMISQAGVALALADLLSSSPQPWARAVAPLVFGTVVVNQLIGPVLFRHALVRAGEVGRRPSPDGEPDPIRGGEEGEIVDR